MTLEIPTGFALCAWEFVMGGDPDPWYVTCGIQTDLANADGTAHANAAFRSWKLSVLPNQNNNLTMTSAILTIGQDGAPTKAYSTEPAAVGNEGGQMLPQNCALLVDKLTAAGGRRNRGRMYVPGILMEEQVNMVGQISSGKVTAWQQAFNNLKTFLNVAADANEPNIPPVVLHATGISATPPPTPVESFRVQSVISTQRKRLR
jgi:hypothetical protein